MAVPNLDFKSTRTDLDEWAQGKGSIGLAEYRARKNQTSIDGLPALK
jgi:hypothetical protein